MKKFVFVYYNGGDMGELSMDEIKAEWGEWFGVLGAALVDPGNPFNDGAQSVMADGASAIPADTWPATGYSIVNAEDMDAAVAMAKGCPLHKHTSGKGSVCVYEAMPM